MNAGRGPSLVRTIQVSPTALLQTAPLVTACPFGIAHNEQQGSSAFHHNPKIRGAIPRETLSDEVAPLRIWNCACIHRVTIYLRAADPQSVTRSKGQGFPNPTATGVRTHDVPLRSIHTTGFPTTGDRAPQYARACN